jgi:hypothetical protein
MLVLNTWNGGITIVISHDEHFITSVARGSLLLMSRLRHSDVLNTNTALGVWGWYSAKVQRRRGSIQGLLIPINPRNVLMILKILQSLIVNNIKDRPDTVTILLYSNLTCTFGDIPDDYNIELRKRTTLLYHNPKA